MYEIYATLPILCMIPYDFANGIFLPAIFLVLDMFYNPLNEDEDMKPEFKITSESWSPEK